MNKQENFGSVLAKDILRYIALKQALGARFRERGRRLVLPVPFSV